MKKLFINRMNSNRKSERGDALVIGTLGIIFIAALILTVASFTKLKEQEAPVKGEVVSLEIREIRTGLIFKRPGVSYEVSIDVDSDGKVDRVRKVNEQTFESVSEGDSVDWE